MKRLEFKGEFFKFNSHRVEAMPFPGKTPTRWFIGIIDRKTNKAIFKYVGKPDAGIRRKVLKIAKRVRGTIQMYEFDKGGPFRAAYLNTPRSEFPISSTCPIVLNLYYHFTTVTGDFFVSGLKFYPKYGVMRHRSFYYFSPYEKDNVPARHEQLRAFKRWITETKVLGAVKKARHDHNPRNVETIRFYDLPKAPVPVLITLHCPNCGRTFTKQEKYRGLIVSCPTCNWGQLA